MYLESTLKHLIDLEAPNNPKVYRDSKSIDGLFDEWNSIMESTIDMGPVESLLKSVFTSSEQGVNMMEMFQNNTSQFIMRLKKNYLLYSDLNDILCGYIYGMKLGFEMITIDKNQGKYLYPQTWSIDVCDFASLNSIERVFLLFKILPKQLVLTHWQLNLLWLISSNLDLHIDLLKMSNNRNNNKHKVY